MRNKGWMRLFSAAAAGFLLMMLTSCGTGGLLTEKYEERTVPVDGSFTDIRIEVRAEDIFLSPSADGKCRAELRELSGQEHDISVQNGVLTIRAEEVPWYERISLFSVGSPRVAVYLPEGEYGRITAEGSTGDIRIDSLSAEDITLSLSTGDIGLTDISCASLTMTGSTGNDTLENVTVSGSISGARSTGDRKMTGVSCGELTLTGSTGDDTLEDVISSGGFSVERSTGDIRLERCDGAKLVLKTDTGDITGTLLTGKVFEAFTDTGKVNVPESDTSGGSCKATADTGDIRLSVP
ncbi:MAG: DUF4097 family beta strand repeat protein [Oscillospiraceae bacterium]|nr:DUF4097 family beta strand repeat protein [Oscillospiraceae bacterium]